MILGGLEMTGARSHAAATRKGGTAAKTGRSQKAGKPGPDATKPAQGAGRKSTTTKATASKRRAEPGDGPLLTEADLADIEQTHTEGLTLAQVIEAFQGRGLHLSEATFRKYVQLGLLGRSRRVGRKGKHQGSLGMYPATTVRRISTIKQMMSASYTIEDIQRTFLRFTDDIEAVQRSASHLLDGFDRELAKASLPAERKKGLQRELSAVRKLAAELVQRVESLERQLVSPLERAARERAFGTGAKGSADELL